MKKKQKIVGILVLVIVVMILLAWPLRSWTRNTLVLNIVGVLHMSSTARIYDKDFSIINNSLSNWGFQLIDKTTLPYDDRDGLNTYEPLKGCRVNGYQGIHETITCQKIGEYKPKSPSDFKYLWLKQASSLEKLLNDSSWQKQYSDQPDYTKLFDTPDNNGNWLTYIKNHGRIRCELTVAYNPPYPNPDDQIWIHEECVREVNLFGGY
jgi:hypothetical protein